MKDEIEFWIWNKETATMFLLVCLGFHNKNTTDWVTYTADIYFFTVFKAESKILFLVWILFLACHVLGYVLTGAKRDLSLFSLSLYPSFYKITNPIRGTLPSWPNPVLISF